MDECVSASGPDCDTREHRLLGSEPSRQGIYPCITTDAAELPSEEGGLGHQQGLWRQVWSQSRTA